MRSRLLSAFNDPLSRITEEKLPPQCHADWKEVQKLITRYQELYPGQLLKLIVVVPDGWHPDNPNPLEASLKRMTNKTGAPVAIKIWDITNRIESLYHDSNRQQKDRRDLLEAWTQIFDLN